RFREHVHVYRINLQPHGLASVRRRTTVDPGDDLLSGDQLILGDTRQGAVDERVGAQFLNDADVDADALGTLWVVAHLEVLRADSQHEVLLVRCLSEGLAGHRNGVVTQVYAVRPQDAPDQ